MAEFESGRSRNALGGPSPLRPKLALTLTTVGSSYALGFEDYRKKSSTPIQEIETISKHFRPFETSGYIARLSKKSPSRFLGEMLKKMTSQNAPESTISQLQEVKRPPKSTRYSTLKGFSTVSADNTGFDNSLFSGRPVFAIR